MLRHRRTPRTAVECECVGGLGSFEILDHTNRPLGLDSANPVGSLPLGINRRKVQGWSN